MIKLTLQDGTILRFNLKDTSREKTLRDAWYSMQDIKNAQSKKIKVKTDRQISYEYEIKEIKDCTFEDKLFKYDVPAVEKPKVADYSSPVKSFDNPFTKMGVDPSKIRQAFHQIFDGLKEIYEGIPEEYKDNLKTFTDKLKMDGISVEVFSQEAAAILSNAMTCDPYQMDQLVEDYKKLWHRHNKGI